MNTVTLNYEFKIYCANMLQPPSPPRVCKALQSTFIQISLKNASAKVESKTYLLEHFLNFFLSIKTEIVKKTAAKITISYFPKQNQIT